MASQPSMPTAIITGASAGMGRGIAMSLAREGKYKLCLMSRNIAKLQETKRLCLEQNKNTQISLDKCDLNDSKDLKESFQRVCTEYGPIHVLIHVAGIFGAGPIVSTDPSQIDMVFNVNLKAVVLGTQICLPFIIESAKLKKAPCAIIEISSFTGTDIGVGVTKGMPFAAYNASKHGVRIFNECLFEEVKQHGIKCCCILPGAVQSPMSEGMPGRENFMEVEDIANTVQYVLNVSDKACPTNIVIRTQRAML